MRQTIRLTEGDLHRIIRNCVNEAMNNIDNEEDLLYSGNFYEAVKSFTQDIGNGEYDNNLKDIISKANDNYYIEQYFDDDVDSYDYLQDWIKDVAQNRLAVIDKDYAFKKGNMPNKYFNNGDYTKERNFNVKSRSGGGASDFDWEQFEKAKANKRKGSIFPSVNKLKGGWKNPKAVDAVNRDVFGTDQADKRPLHRKGSLNRAFDK